MGSLAGSLAWRVTLWRDESSGVRAEARSRCLEESQVHRDNESTPLMADLADLVRQHLPAKVEAESKGTIYLVQANGYD